MSYNLQYPQHNLANGDNRNLTFLMSSDGFRMYWVPIQWNRSSMLIKKCSSDVLLAQGCTNHQEPSTAIEDAGFAAAWFGHDFALILLNRSSVVPANCNSTENSHKIHGILVKMIKKNVMEVRAKKRERWEFLLDLVNDCKLWLTSNFLLDLSIYMKSLIPL